MGGRRETLERWGFRPGLHTTRSRRAPFQELRISGDPDGRLGPFVLAFGEDAAGELYVLTTDTAGPTGETGRVYRLVRPGNRR